MKILIVALPVNPRRSDFCDATVGEVAVTHGLVCTNPEKAARCGCDTTHRGLGSGLRTTTVAVSETDWAFDELVSMCRNDLLEGNWVEIFGADTLDETAEELVVQSIRVAQDHPMGIVLRPRFDHNRELWFYDWDGEQ
jgi:hypothetical protein